MPDFTVGIMCRMGKHDGCLMVHHGKCRCACHTQPDANFRPQGTIAKMQAIRQRMAQPTLPDTLYIVSGPSRSYLVARTGSTIRTVEAMSNSDLEGP